MSKNEALVYIDGRIYWDEPCCGVLRMDGLPDGRWTKPSLAKLTEAVQVVMLEERRGVSWAFIVNQSSRQSSVWSKCGWRVISKFFNPNSNNMVTVWELRAK